MKNIFITAALLCLMLNLIACDSFVKIPDVHEGVLVDLPWCQHGAGGSIAKQPLPAGNRNIGNGHRSKVYIVNMALQTAETEVKELMQDDLNQPAKMRINYQVKSGISPLLLVNYTLQASAGPEKPEGSSQEVDLKSIFDTNILPVWDMIGRMVLCRSTSKDIANIPRENLGRDILQELIARLDQIRKPKVDIAESGQLVYSQETIAITDLIEIVSVDIGELPPPNEVKTVITSLETNRADLNTAIQDEINALAERKVKLTEAKRRAEENAKITKNWTPGLRLYNFQEMLRTELPTARNTRVFYVPTGVNVTVGAIGSPPVFTAGSPASQTEETP